MPRLTDYGKGKLTILKTVLDLKPRAGNGHAHASCAQRGVANAPRETRLALGLATQLDL